MTPKEAKAAADRANAITHAHQALVAAREKLAYVKKWVADGRVWQPELRLNEDAYSARRTITVTIPSAWIIQQAVDEVKAAERRYILAGGTL